ncbi:hypothetical protein [Tabrizicola thermarum]|uniref:hypothetical protein n=1 Tax=Tabrizicola thermarum TaxID=2670345 RepID=UPI000FFBBF75|nr:hypothetical protein [Tabrizicola thermarum]
MRLALIALALAATSARAELASRIPGLDIVTLDRLPPAPADRGDAAYCSHLASQPETAAGRAVQAQGWTVTGEVPFGTLTAVSFVGSFLQGTSGTCLRRDGNVGFFAGDKLTALIYARNAEELPIGFIAPFADSGLRLWSGDYLPEPLADIQPTAGGITVVPLAATEPVCHGTAEVPLIYGLPIDVARKRLAEAGWQPVPFQGDRSESMGLDAEIAARGVPEVDVCSGTGFGFCGYAYAGPAGSLAVTTMGEFGEDGSFPVVADYGVDCR